MKSKNDDAVDTPTDACPNVEIVDIYPPSAGASALTFTDVDMNSGQIAGTLVVSAFDTNVGTDEFLVYWGQSSSAKSGIDSSVLATITVITGETPEYYIPDNTAIPGDATHLLVYASRRGSEIASPMDLLLTDLYYPTGVPTAITFTDTCKFHRFLYK